MNRILLSPPDVGVSDGHALTRAFETGWVAPLGPEVDAFEAELADVVGREHAVALSSGTAALHLALLLLGVGPGDRVLVSDMTFAASVNAIRYVGAEPVFIDSRLEDWNLDPELVEQALADGPVTACMPVDLYGQMADHEAIEHLCEAAGVAVVTDAAEALGASRSGRPAGSTGAMAALSFNGNKIITTSGGGALLTDDSDWADRARFLATQAREDAPHYEHTTIGYNYRLSNLLAGLGRSQLLDLERRVATRRDHNRFYRERLGDLPGVEFMPEAPGAESTFWLTCLTIDPTQAGVDRERVRLALDAQDIEARPVWKPMHMQPVFAGFGVYGGSVSEKLFENGLCLPSGSTLTDADRLRVVGAVREVFA